MYFRAQLGLALLLVISGALHAQVYELRAGASTLFDAQGATLKIHGTNFDSSVGFGMLNGHFTAGGQAVRDWGATRMTLGQQYIPLRLPTDVFDPGQVFTGIGYSYRTTLREDRHMTLFGGVTSSEGGTPLFASANSSLTPAAILLWKRHVGHGITASTSMMASKKLTAIESLEWKVTRHTYGAVSLGVGSNSPYGAASYAVEQQNFQFLAEYVSANRDFQRLINPALLTPPEPVRENISARYHLTRWLSVSAGRQNYRNQDSAGVTGAISKTNFASVELGSSRVGAGFNVYDSRYDGRGNDAFSFSAFREHGRLRLSAMMLKSKPTFADASTIFIGSTGVRVSSHLRITETASASEGTTSFSHGGELQWTFGSLRVDHQLFYLPTQPDHPLQQAVTFDLQQRVLPKLTAHASSFVSPNGRIQYTFELGTVFGPAYKIPATKGNIGLQIIVGRVVDIDGSPIEGASLMVGHQQLYTDSKGNFFLRLAKPQTLPVRVLTDEFLSGGAYNVLDAPVTITSSSEDRASIQRIVVKRIAGGTSYGSR